ncbi:MAG: DUF222 domain-containing protein, partial [Actinomycetes bacterium]
EQHGRVIEAAVAKNVSETTLRNQLWVAREVTGRLDRTGTSLREGRISYWHARAMVESVAGLTDEQASEVEHRALARSDSRPVSQFRRLCRNAVLAVDAEAARRRHREAVNDRSVSWWASDDGMAVMQVVASAVDIQAMHGALTLLAGPRESDDPRTLGARRVDALLGLCLAAVAPDDDLDAVAVRRARAGRVPVSAHIVIDLATLLGLADNPAQLRGYGTIPAGLARDWLTDATTWRRLVTDPVQGHLLDYGPAVRFAPDTLRRFVQARDQTCTFPRCRRPAENTEVDHHPPWQPDRSGGRTSAMDTASLCPRHHHLRTHANWDLLERRDGDSLWRSPNGRTYRVPAPSVLDPV